jgi:hypothetical protein
MLPLLLAAAAKERLLTWASDPIKDRIALLGACPAAALSGFYAGLK